MKTPMNHRHHQRGVTLMELMVGLTVGLLVIAVAMGGLMLSRGLSGTVSDASSIQQQGAYAMRQIGMQLRQAGSLYLNPDPAEAGVNDVFNPVVFETDAKSPDGGLDFEQSETFVAADDASFSTAYRRYQDNVFISDNPFTISRNCLGGPSDPSPPDPSDPPGSTPPFDAIVQSNFALSGTTITCSGNGATAQPFIQNVAQFEMSYLLQERDGPGASSTIKYVKASDFDGETDPKWRSVQGVQVCLVLYGIEPVGMPAGSSYTDCDGTSVDMTTLGPERKNRMHVLFRNVFQLRSQGLIGVDS